MIRSSRIPFCLHGRPPAVPPPTKIEPTRDWAAGVHNTYGRYVKIRYSQSMVCVVTASGAACGTSVVTAALLLVVLPVQYVWQIRDAQMHAGLLSPVRVDAAYSFS